MLAPLSINNLAIALCPALIAMRRAVSPLLDFSPMSAPLLSKFWQVSHVRPGQLDALDSIVEILIQLSWFRSLFWHQVDLDFAPGALEFSFRQLLSLLRGVQSHGHFLLMGLNPVWPRPNSCVEF
jgi:hypothetical protein